MMGYVLVKVKPGKESGVAQEIVRVKEIREAAWTYGFCDILLKTEVKSIQDLDRIVLKRLRNTPGVASTETMIVSPIPIYAARPHRKRETKRKYAQRKAR